MAITQQMITDNEVRALSWKQPMAELMKYGKVETRTWATPYRGIVLICSSVVPYGDRELIDLCGPEQLARIIQVLGKKWTHSVKRGSAIAVGRLADCCAWQPSSLLSHSTYVKHRPGLLFHIYEDVTPIETFPWRGQQGWKTLTPEEKAKIKIL